MRTQTFILPAFLFLCLFTYAQKNIVVKTEEKKVTIKKSLNGNDFYINLTIQNNTNDTLKIPPVNSNIDDVWVRVPPHNEWYFVDKICICSLITPVEQTLLPQSSAKIKLRVFGDLFIKKGRNKAWFYPIITSLRNDTKIRVSSNKIIVNVE